MLDRAETLIRAAGYDRWVRAKVQASRDDTRPAISEDEWQSIRAAKLAEIGRNSVGALRVVHPGDDHEIQKNNV